MNTGGDEFTGCAKIGDFRPQRESDRQRCHHKKHRKEYGVSMARIIDPVEPDIVRIR